MFGIILLGSGKKAFEIDKYEELLDRAGKIRRRYE